MPHADLDTIVNLSYTLFAASYLMRDILWLRLFTVCSLLLLIPYFYFQPEPLWVAIFWNLSFLLINIFWISRLLVDRQPYGFTDEQKRIWETTLKEIHPKYARKLFNTAGYETVAPNQVLIKQGDTSDTVALVCEGTLLMSLDGSKVETIGPGNFVGSAMFLEKSFPMRSITTVTTMEETRIMRWRIDELRKIADEDQQFGMTIQAIMGLDIAQLVIKAWHRAVRVD